MASFVHPADTSGIGLAAEASHISSEAVKKSVPQVVTLFAPIETSPGVCMYSTIPLAKLSEKATVSRQ